LIEDSFVVGLLDEVKLLDIEELWSKNWEPTDNQKIIRLFFAYGLKVDKKSFDKLRNKPETLKFIIEDCVFMGKEIQTVFSAVVNEPEILKYLKLIKVFDEAVDKADPKVGIAYKPRMNIEDADNFIARLLFGRILVNDAKGIRHFPSYISNFECLFCSVFEIRGDRYGRRNIYDVIQMIAKKNKLHLKCEKDYQQMADCLRPERYYVSNSFEHCGPLRNDY
jgi:hypothetical protein